MPKTLLYTLPDGTRFYFGDDDDPDFDRAPRGSGLTPVAEEAGPPTDPIEPLPVDTPAETKVETPVEAPTPGPQPPPQAAPGETPKTISYSRLLEERPDVLKAYYESYYGDNNDKHSTAWMKRVGGTEAEDYAKYWYSRYGKWEGYSQSDKTAADNMDVRQLLADRPDVYRAFYEQYYGPNNDRHSHAWEDRVGGKTVEDYAKYWYETYGKREGYKQHHDPDSDAGTQPQNQHPDSGPEEIPPHLEDPSLDPWNHPVIYPDYPRPPDLEYGRPQPSADDFTAVGRSLQDGVDM